MLSYIILTYISESVVLTRSSPVDFFFSAIKRVDFWLGLDLGAVWSFLQAFSHRFLKERAPSKKRQYFSMYSVSDLILNSLEKTALKVEK